MRRLMLPLALVIAGCGSSDPAKSRLAAGQKVMVPASKNPSIIGSATLYPMDGDVFPKGSVPAKWPVLYVGGEAVVVEDAGGEDDRRVKIMITKQARVVAGVELVGLECRAERSDLRPIP